MEDTEKGKWLGGDAGGESEPTPTGGWVKKETKLFFFLTLLFF